MKVVWCRKNHEVHGERKLIRISSSLKVSRLYVDV